MKARNKGAGGERELCAILTDHLGTVVKRQLGAARDGGHDVTLGDWRIECKRQERLNIPAWWRQAVENAQDKIPMVAFRQNRDEWLVVHRLTDWIKLVREDVANASTQTGWNTGQSSSDTGPADSTSRTDTGKTGSAQSADLSASQWGDPYEQVERDQFLERPE